MAQDYVPGYRASQRPREMVQQVQPQRQSGFLERFFGRRDELPTRQPEVYVRTKPAPQQAKNRSYESASKTRSFEGEVMRDQSGAFIEPLTGKPLDPRYIAKKTTPKNSPKKEVSTIPAVAAVVNSTGLYCVRACDGFFFPIANPTKITGEASSQTEFCSSLCPNASMEVYKGTSIETAVGANRKSYRAHPKSFAYREKMDNSCSCKGERVGGLATLPFTRDFTLRTGDVVLMDDGAHQFKGGDDFPYKQRDFAMLSKGSSRLSPDLRNMLESKNVAFGTVVNTQVASNQLPVSDSTPDLQGLVSAKSVRIINILAPVKERPKMLVDIIKTRKVAQNF